MKLRIAPDGTVRGLWDDRIDWPSLGRVSVRRASHVEYCDRRQMWYVRRAQPRSATALPAKANRSAVWGTAGCGRHPLETSLMSAPGQPSGLGGPAWNGRSAGSN
jgi:hypothetical protein